MKNTIYIYQCFGGLSIDKEISRLFQGILKKEIEEYVQSEKLQEIRIKINEPCILIINNSEKILDHVVSSEEINFILQRISNFSIYAYEQEIKQGFITIQGGHRVGIAGECVMEFDRVKTIRNISSLNIRICREIIGCSDKVIRYIADGNNIYNTLIISPPGCGKTTLLRDMVRNISEHGKRVSVIDERSEIAACFRGVPQMTLGLRCDILDNCLKSQGMIMAIRSLSPEVIACDEIGSKEDILSLKMAYISGVSVLSTIHGFDLNDIMNRDIIKELIKNNILQRIIVLSKKNGVGTIEKLYSISKEGVKQIW